MPGEQSLLCKLQGKNPCTITDILQGTYLLKMNICFVCHYSGINGIEDIQIIQLLPLKFFLKWFGVNSRQPEQL
jgi:hypothetical protein